MRKIPYISLCKIRPTLHVTFITVLLMFLQFPRRIRNMLQCLSYQISIFVVTCLLIFGSRVYLMYHKCLISLALKLAKVC